MDSDRLNRWLTLVANTGVLVGLILLVVEIRQSNLLALADIEQTRSDSLLQWRREWVTNDHIVPMLLERSSIFSMEEYFSLDVAERQAAVENMLDEMDPTTRMRMRFFFLTSFWDYENLHAQYQRGLISEQYWTERIVAGILQDAPAWKASTGGSLLAGRQEFIDEIESLLEQYPNGRPPQLQ